MCHSAPSDINYIKQAACRLRCLFPSILLTPLWIKDPSSRGSIVQQIHLEQRTIQNFLKSPPIFFPYTKCKHTHCRAPRASGTLEKKKNFFLRNLRRTFLFAWWWFSNWLRHVGMYTSKPTLPQQHNCVPCMDTLPLSLALNSHITEKQQNHTKRTSNLYAWAT